MVAPDPTPPTSFVADAPADRGLRVGFDLAADRYHRARPRAPRSLLDDLVSVTGTGRVLEIGPATGVVTEQLVDRGFEVTAVELGPTLAEAARANLGDRVEVVHASFDEWQLGDRAPFDAVIAATSWHWLDPAARYDRAARALRLGGHLAFWAATHIEAPDADPFYERIQPTYEAIGIGDASALPRAGYLPERTDEIEASGRFEVVEVSHHDWTTEYTVDGYLDLLRTFSGHIVLEPARWARLEADIRRLLADQEHLVRGWGAVLHIARVRPHRVQRSVAP